MLPTHLGHRVPLSASLCLIPALALQGPTVEAVLLPWLTLMSVQPGC